MTSIYFTLTPGTYEDICCSILQTWAIENFITAARSLCWLVFVLGRVHYDVRILEALVSNKKLLLELNNDSNKGDVTNTDDDRPDEYTGPCKRRRTESTENVDASGEQGTNDDEWQHEDGDNTTDQQDSTGSGDDGDNDDNDDSHSDNEYSDDDDEDYDEEEEESDDTESSEDDMDINPLLAHAREVYASNSFRIFEREYRRSICLEVDCTGESDRGQAIYKVHKFGDSSGKYKVTAECFGFDGIVNCSCNYFSITGFLCCHSLKVLPCLQINKIPDRYLLRWQLRNFNSNQTPKPSSLETRKCPQSADDSTKVSRGKRRSLYITHLDYDVNGTDVDYIVAPLLRHAKDIYLPEIYNLFRKEYKRSELLSTYPLHRDMNERGIILVYNVHKPGRSGNFMVHSEPANGTVNCTCQQFSATGILCSHALLVLYVTDIVRIPHQYIDPRLVKNLYVVKNCDIHGPKYPEFESLHRWMVKEERIDKVWDLVSKCKAVGVDTGFIEGCLRQLSVEQCNKVAVGGDVFSYKYPKAQVKFWDDQCIRISSYKKPAVIARRFLLSTGLAIRSRCSPHESPSLLSS